MITKKLLFLLLVSVILCPVAKAQFFRVEDVARHDLSLSYGIGILPHESHSRSCPALHNSGMANNTFNYSTDRPMFISCNGVYIRNFMTRLGVGLQFNYYSVENDFNVYHIKYYKKLLGGIEEEGFNIMPTIRCFWWNHNHWGFYSRLAAGLNLHKIKEYDWNVHDDVDLNCGTKITKNFAYQLTVVGAEVGGRRVRAFGEFGYGYQGHVSLGVRVKIGYKMRD